MSEDTSWSERLGAWLDDRLDLSSLGRLARKKEVPIHRHTFWYYLGGMTLFLFVIQVTTGILLLFYYRPSSAEAFESVRFLMTEVTFGWLIRSVHSWAANLMILTLFIHFFSVLLLKAYRPPRELTWYSGFALLGLGLAFGFTGYLLPWNQLAYFATRVGTDIVGAVPLAGDFLLRMLRGGTRVSGATLTRFYAIHAAVLPALAVLLLGLHLYMVQKHGMSVPPKVKQERDDLRSFPFFPNFLLRDLVGWLAALAIVAALAAYLPAELGEKADPFASAPAGIKPEWYFMFMFETLKLLPDHILGVEGDVFGVAFFGLAALFLLLLPVLDRRAKRGKPSPLVTAVGWAVILYMVVFTIKGYTS